MAMLKETKKEEEVKKEEVKKEENTNVIKKIDNFTEA